jgi:hypothetical protein
MVRALAMVALVCGGCNSILGIGDVHPTGATIDGGADARFDAPPDGPPVPLHALVATTDYASKAALDRIDVRAGTIATDVLVGKVSTIPALRHYGSELLLVNGAAPEEVLVLDGTPTVKETYALPAGTIAVDAAAAGTKLYVASGNSAGVIVIDRNTKQMKTIAFPTIDPDGVPNCYSVYYTGTRVYVACSIFDASFTPRGPAVVVVVDPFNDSIVRTVTLPDKDAIGLLEPSNPSAPTTGVLTIGLSPSFTDFTKGCLAEIHLTEPETADCLLQNTAIGGYANHAEGDPTGATLWIASTIYDASFNNAYGRLVPYDLAHGSLGSPVSQPGEPVVDVAACPDDFLVVTERGPSETGARVYHAGSEGGLLDTGYGPEPGGAVICY